MAVKVLTIDQETEILNYIYQNNLEPLGNGAARLVFDAPTEILRKLEIFEPCVIKVALGQGGVNQNIAETFAYSDHGDYYPLAKIFCATPYIEIMEKVEPLSEAYRDYREYEYYNEDDETSCCDAEEFVGDYNVDIDEAEEALGVAVKLEDLFGSTGDNGQVGIAYNRHGEQPIVAYDYGYHSHSNKSQTSDLSDYFDDGYYDDYVSEYICALIDLVQGLYCDMEDLEYHMIEHFNGNDETTTYYDVIGINKEGLVIENCSCITILSEAEELAREHLVEYRIECKLVDSMGEEVDCWTFEEHINNENNFEKMIQQYYDNC